MQESLEKWTQRGSGWAVDQVHTLWLDIARYQPLRGGSYIPLPAAVKNKKAVVNVKNKDDHCLRWALRAALFQVAKDPQRPTKYPTKDGLVFTGIDAPTPISQIPKVEWQNDLAINVFGWNKGVIVHHISNQPEDMPRTNLLLIEKAGNFQANSREDLLEDHKPECQGIGQTAVRVEMPEEGKNNLTFQNHHRQLPVPYIIYADFEALTTKLAGPEPDPTKSNTQKTQQHEACCYSYIVVRCDGQTEKPVKYRGPNAAEHFLQALQEEEQKIKGVMANPKAMRMTREDWRAYNTATLCHVCDKPLEGDSLATTATSQGGSEVQHTMPATSSCGWTPKPPSSRWSSTTCEGTTATCWCRPSQRSRARWAASPTIQRSTSASPSGSSASSTAPNSCWPH